MKAAVITIGDEILLGQILDTNSRFLAKGLTQCGAEVVKMYTVSDNKSAILNTLADAFNQAEIVLVTGGLGPTKDDITKAALAEFWGTSVSLNEQAENWLQEMFADCPERLNTANQTQAFLPNGCLPLHNRRGTACGMWFERGGKILVSLPGVPFEAEGLWQEEVFPRLKEHCKNSLLEYRMITVLEIPEAQLAMRLSRFEEKKPSGVALAYLPAAGYVRLRLTAKGKEVQLLEDCFDFLKQELNGLRFVVSSEDDSAEKIFISRIAQSGFKVACAESCTGGNIARLLTEQAGASAYFVGGVVAYCNDVKQKILGVNKADLEKYGAVSEAVALQMAQGVRQLTGADFAVSTTGIAGPGGATAQKPVGTVWIAVAGPKGAKAEKFLFSRTRERNIAKSSVKALEMLADAVWKQTNSPNA